jgi:hypothetical protein
MPLLNPLDQCERRYCGSIGPISRQWIVRARGSERETKMGLYAKYVLPRLIDLAMGNKDTTRLRAGYLLPSSQ